jgi:hypothetical protein
MKKYVFGLILALAGLSASADLVSRHDKDFVILRDTAGSCPAAIQEKINPEQVGRFKRADVQIEGKDYVACWAEASGAVFLIYDDGDQGLLPLNLFEPYQGT